jgi:hypothetical protein
VCFPSLPILFSRTRTGPPLTPMGTRTTGWEPLIYATTWQPRSCVCVWAYPIYRLSSTLRDGLQEEKAGLLLQLNLSRQLHFWMPLLTRALTIPLMWVYSCSSCKHRRPWRQGHKRKPPTGKYILSPALHLALRECGRTENKSHSHTKQIRVLIGLRFFAEEYTPKSVSETSSASCSATKLTSYLTAFVILFIILFYYSLSLVSTTEELLDRKVAAPV